MRQLALAGWSAQLWFDICTFFVGSELSMIAVCIRAHGQADQVEIADLKRPRLGDTQVLLRVQAASLNHLDLFVRQGWPGLKVSRPHILGSDACGQVTAFGAKLAKNRSIPRWLRVGAAVLLYPARSCSVCQACRIGQPLLCHRLQVIGEDRSGTFTEWMVVDPSQLAPKPKHLSINEGAALSLTYLTAWRMLVTLAKIKARQTVLVHGIGGGVALAALAIARAHGCRVWVTSRDPNKLRFAAKLGAARGWLVEDDWVAAARERSGRRGVDVVVDCVGERTWDGSLRAIRRGGCLVTCGATSGSLARTQVNRLFWNHLTIYGSTLGSRQEFSALLKFVSRHRLRPVIDSVYPLTQAKLALAKLESGKQMGKIVLSVAQ
jgi:NADPH:quinone reductase-like Zn-dependent oxidoreductase